MQLCPDQPCGAGTTVGSGVTLPAAADTTTQDLPCTAFSVGVDANEIQAIKAIACKGDLIRINGEYLLIIVCFKFQFMFCCILINFKYYRRWLNTMLPRCKSFSNPRCSLWILFQHSRSKRRCCKISSPNLWLVP